MAELTDEQRQMLAQGLNRPYIQGSAPIMQPSIEPFPPALTRDLQLAELPPAVAQAIAPNLGMNFGRKGDFVTGTPPPFARAAAQPMVNIMPPEGDPGFEMRNQPWWNSDRMFRRT